MTEATPQLNHPMRPMTGREPGEHHRVATSLELLLDLAFVAAIGIAAGQFAHVLAEGHVGVALLAFGFVMFAIIWAWINFSWFASAFDTDDWFYRLTTMVQMVGVLVLALGLSDVFESLDEGHGLENRVVVAGYVVMRLALVVQWTRVAVQSPRYRRTAKAYIAYTAIAQVGWVALAVSHASLPVTLACACVLYVVELGGPFLAERRAGRTPWHPHHIAERYGLLTIIALGEGVLGTISAVQPVIAEYGWTPDAIVLVAAGTVLTFGVWWVYFNVPFAQILHRRPGAAFLFGYGHLPLFASVAAMGAGLDVAAYVVEGTAEVGTFGAVQAVAMPVMVFMVVLFVLYAVLVRQLDLLHLALFAGVVVTLVVALGLAASGAPFGVCVMIVAIAPAIVVVGYELLGHRHAREHLAALG
ncbi:MAG: low temperature requirement protein A [Propionicimonas sp.]|uniref:low temperature requirement protein A n=1 Tax=Propionicimonas sp. TaxID=1955623 RepID=UPI003D137D90